MKKIERKPTRDQIAQMIRYQILSGAMKAGDELTQESIAEQLGLSRMPVREALQSLEQEGFLVRLPNRHMQVSTLAVEDVSHIFRVIAVMAAELTQSELDQAARAAEGAAAGLNNAIGKISAMLDGSIDTTPTIRPVVDLSSAASGAAALNSLFAMNPSMSSFGGSIALQNVGELRLDDGKDTGWHTVSHDEYERYQVGDTYP